MDQAEAVATRRRVSQLIELGRDREAAELAITRTFTFNTPLHADPGATLDVLSQLDELSYLLDGALADLGPDDLDRSTPCTEFAVRGVLEHMIGGATMFTAAYRGDEPGEPPVTSPLAAIGPALASLFDAIRAPGALAKTIAAPFGQVSGEEFARYVVLDGLVHGWDISRAIGQDYAPSQALVANVQAYADRAIQPMRGDAFAEPTEPPAGASAMERLAAFTGRAV